jgi:hypothetical protein
MSTGYDDSRGDRDVLRIPVIRVAYALSLLIHAAVLWPWLPSQRFITPGEEEHKEVPTRLQVRIAPSAIPLPPPPAAAQSRPTPPPRPLRAPASAPRQPPASSAPVIARDAPGPAIPPPAPTASAPAPARPPVVADLAALIEARRQSRGEIAPPAPPAPPAPQVVEDENARRARIVAQNLGSGRAPSFGEERRNSGGIFQVEHVYYDYADFTFYGWNRDISRNSRQLIEVRKGNASDIRVAVVRRMIAIIREYEKEDFRWESTASQRSVTLSARQRDNASLEAYFLHEFFPEFAQAR